MAYLNTPHLNYVNSAGMGDAAGIFLSSMQAGQNMALKKAESAAQIANMEADNQLQRDIYENVTKPGADRRAQDWTEEDLKEFSAIWESGNKDAAVNYARRRGISVDLPETQPSQKSEGAQLEQAARPDAEPVSTESLAPREVPPEVPQLPADVVNGGYIPLPTPNGMLMMPSAMLPQGKRVEPYQMVAGPFGQPIPVPTSTIQDVAPTTQADIDRRQQIADATPPVDALLEAALASGRQNREQQVAEAAQPEPTQSLPRLTLPNGKAIDFDPTAARSVRMAESSFTAEQMMAAAERMPDETSAEKMQIIANLARAGMPVKPENLISLMAMDSRQLIAMLNAQARAAEGEAGRAFRAEQGDKNREAAMARARVTASGQRQGRESSGESRDYDDMRLDLEKLAARNKLPDNIQRWTTMKESLAGVLSGNSTMDAALAVRSIAKSANSGALTDTDVSDMAPNAGIAERMVGMVRRAATGNRLSDGEAAELVKFLRTGIANQESRLRSFEKDLLNLATKSSVWKRNPQDADARHAEIFGRYPGYKPLSQQLSEARSAPASQDVDDLAKRYAK